MIVPMKKVTILFEMKNSEGTISAIRGFGVLHIEHHHHPEGEGIITLQDRYNLITSSLEILSDEIKEKTAVSPEKITCDWESVTNRLIFLKKRKNELESLCTTIQSQVADWELWGDVDQSQVQQLRDHGIILKLYRIPEKKIPFFPDEAIVKKIFTDASVSHYVVISRRMFDCDYEEVIPPKETVSVLQSKLRIYDGDLEKIREEIISNARFSGCLSDIANKIAREIEIQQVWYGMGQEKEIGYITGYIPSDKESFLVTRAKEKGWGIMISDPSEEDNVPTLLRNPKWVMMIHPVLQLLGLTPGYRELDISLLFLAFFSLFFGILIGDAGYGLVYIFMTIVFAYHLNTTRSLNEEMKTTISLFLLLGSCAVGWGILTGTYFGQQWAQPLVPLLKDTETMESLCFFLGATQLSLAHIWRAVLKFPSLTAGADIGYICILWTAFFLARTLILGKSFPEFGIWLVLIGVCLVVFFTNPQHRILRGMGEGVGAIVLGFMNNITDVISYVRLFAVGLAGLAIAETTNTMASGLGTSLPGVVAGVVILFIGHSLNIVLGIISVLVHGVRLNVLEFSGHAGVTWSGFPFKPFKE